MAMFPEIPMKKIRGVPVSLTVDTGRKQCRICMHNVRIETDRKVYRVTWTFPEIMIYAERHGLTDEYIRKHGKQYQNDDGTMREEFVRDALDGKELDAYLAAQRQRALKEASERLLQILDEDRDAPLPEKLVQRIKERSRRPEVASTTH